MSTCTSYHLLTLLTCNCTCISLGTHVNLINLTVLNYSNNRYVNPCMFQLLQFIWNKLYKRIDWRFEVLYCWL